VWLIEDGFGWWMLRKHVISDRAQDAADARKIRMFNGLKRSEYAPNQGGPAVAIQQSPAAPRAPIDAASFGNHDLDIFSTSEI
jgi:hypothetical protein